MKKRLLVPLLAAAALALSAPLAAPPEASAKLPVLGIADNNVSTLTDPRFRAMGVRHVRLTIPWNIFFRPSSAAAQRYNQYLDVARQRGQQVMVAFTLGDYTSKRKRFRLAPLKLYLTMFKRFRARHPSVKEFIPWNEANHRFMPTRKGRGIKQAAQYYNGVRKRCTTRSGCKIVAADVIDAKGMSAWLKRFRRYAKYWPRLWGLHNYLGIAKRSSFTTRLMLKRVRGFVWLAETGGMVEHRGRRPKLRYSEGRQLREMRYLFRLLNARRYRKRITRAYIYNWRQYTCNAWDSALITGGGRERPAFFTVKRQAGLRGYKPF